MTKNSTPKRPSAPPAFCSVDEERLFYAKLAERMFVAPDGAYRGYLG